MRIKLMSLRYVPEDEIAEIAEMLESANIKFYFTHSGNFGVSLPALWLPNDNQADKARSLLAEYQKNRTKIARENYQQSEKRTLLDNFYQNPLRFILYCLVAGFFLYLLIVPILFIKNL